MKKFIRGLALFLVFAFLYAPIIVLIIYSFNSGTTRGSFEGFSFVWYKSLFDDSQVMKALGNTFTVAVANCYNDTDVEKAFFTKLVEMGIPVKIESNLF